ncbi:YwiC-like family protein [Bacillaceae bacterium W0354]
MMKEGVNMAKKKKSKIVLPKEHGSWAMYLLPVLLGILFTEPNWLHLFFAIGWFFLYLTSTPLLNIFRNKRKADKMMPWVLGYGITAVIFLIPIVIFMPEVTLFGFAMIPFLLISVYFIKKRNERSLINDLSGILIFTIGGAASYYIGKEAVTTEMFLLLIVTTAYFLGSAFYIKSLIRELKNPKFKWKSHMYHIFLLILPFIIRWEMLIFAFLPSVIKDWVTPRTGVIKPMHSGIIEIINAIIFLTLVLIV